MAAKCGEQWGRAGMEGAVRKSRKRKSRGEEQNTVEGSVRKSRIERRSEESRSRKSTEEEQEWKEQ